MPVTPRKIEATTEITRRAVRSRVATATVLGSDWTEQPDLHCDELALLASPGLDSCQLSYVYGPIRREGGGDFEQFERLDLLGLYVRVTLVEAGLDGEDLTWYGLVEVDDNTPMGSQAEGDTPRGTQRFTAYGLLRLLERTIIRSAVVDTTVDGDLPIDAVKIEYGIGYNLPAESASVLEGNRTADRQLGNPHLPYWFSAQYSSPHTWGAEDAVKHLLYWHPPKDGLGDPCCAVELDDADDLLSDVFDAPVVTTDGRSVKAVLDELIPYRRGLSYTVRYEEAGGDGRGVLKITPFSWALEGAEYGVNDQGEPLGYLRPNTDQVELDFENAIDVDARIVEAWSTAYDEVVALGQFATSTCTLAFGKTANDRGAAFQIVPDWSDDLEQEWLTAAQDFAIPDYAAMSPLQQFLANTHERSRDKLHPVWRRFRISPEFPGIAWNYALDGTDAATVKYWVNPPWPEQDGKSVRDTDPFAEPLQPHSDTHDEARVAWPRVMFEQSLPFIEGVSYAGDRIASQAWKDDLPSDQQTRRVRPLLFVETASESSTGGPYGGGRSYRRLDKLAELSGTETARHRFSVTAQFPYPWASFEVHVSGAPQWFIARNSAPAMGYLDPPQDPTKESGIDYSEIRGTFCLRLPWRVAHREQLTTDPPAGRQQRTLYLPVDARLDYVVPDTVVSVGSLGVSTGVNPVGKLELSEGGFVRDDRDQLRRIAQAAAAWYQTRRQSLALSYRGIVQLLDVGTLIASVGGRYTLEGVNTPVTAIRYNLVEQRTELETSMLEVDFR